MVPLRHFVVDASDGPFGSSLKAEHYRDGGARVIRLGNIGPAQWNDDDAAYVDTDYWRTLRRHHAHAGDLIVAGLGDENQPLGRACVAPELGPAMVKADCYRLSVDPAKADAHFLTWYLSSAAGAAEALRLADGATRARLTLPKALSIPVPGIHPGDQRAIASYLAAIVGRMDGLIRDRNRQMELLTRRTQATIDEYLSVETRGQPKVPLKRMLEGIEQGWSPQCESRPADDGEWGVLKAGAANGGRFRPEENKALPSDVAPVIALEVRQGDVLVSRANTRSLVASVCVVPPVRPRLLLCDKLFRLHPRAGVDGRYVAFALQTTSSRAMIEAEATGASDSMLNVGQDTIRNVVVAVRSHRDQVKVADALESALDRIDRLRRAIESQIDLLLERRQALITAAVTGQLEIPGVAA